MRLWGGPGPGQHCARDLSLTSGLRGATYMFLAYHVNLRVLNLPCLQSAETGYLSSFFNKKHKKIVQWWYLIYLFSPTMQASYESLPIYPPLSPTSMLAMRQ